MRQINLFITDKDYNHFIELVKNLQYVKKIEVDESGQTKEKIIDGLKKAIHEVEMVKAGDLKARLLKDLIDELNGFHNSTW